MLKELVKIANKLDSLGFQREADVIDAFIRDTLDKSGVNYTYHWSVNWNSEPASKTASFLHEGVEQSEQHSTQEKRSDPRK